MSRSRSHPDGPVRFVMQRMARRRVNAPGLATRIEVVMQGKPTPQTYHKTPTPGIYRRAKRYVAKWTEEGRVFQRSFPSYDTACAFRRDYILPFRERKAFPPSMEAPPGRTGGYVYFFQSRGAGESVKIGWSTDPSARLRTLSTAHVDKLDLVALIPGPRALERRLQRHFEDYRRNGEWFSREVLNGLTVLAMGES